MGKASTRYAVFYDVCGGAIFDQVIHFMQIRLLAVRHYVHLPHALSLR